MMFFYYVREYRGFDKISLVVENSTLRRQFLSCSSKTVLSEAVARRCSVNNAFKKNDVIFTGKHLCRSLFYNKVNRVCFHFLVLKVIPSEAFVYK